MKSISTLLTMLVANVTRQLFSMRKTAGGILRITGLEVIKMSKVNKFSQDEIFVIMACKNHFKNDIFTGYEAAELIIQNLVYAHPRRLAPLQMIKFLRPILLKAERYSLEQWEEKNNKFMETATKPHIRSESTYLENLLLLHFVAIQCLRVFSDGEMLIDLTITPEEKKVIINLFTTEIYKRVKEKNERKFRVGL
jgi:hypothetical protein